MTGLATEAWVHVLGLTLLHGVWQGVVVALVAAGLMRAVGPDPGARHAIASAGLGLVVALAAVTALAVLPAAPEEAAATASSAGAAAGPATAAAVSAGPLRGLVDRVYGLVWGAIPWLVSAWLVGVLVLAARIAIGVAWTFHARRTADPVPPALESRARSLARRMGVGHAFGIAASSRVRVPTVVGWRRPVVLLPGAMIGNAPVTRLDPVLAHELAHVKRGDPVLALVQSVVETLLFHHPAARWLGEAARAAREHRSDDAAVEACGDVSAYITALVELESQRGAPALAGVAASGGSLVDRARRLVDRDRARRGGWTRPAAAILALALAVPALAAGARLVPAVEARPGGRVTIAAHDPAGRFGVVMVEGRVQAVGLDARPVPRDRWIQRGDSLRVRDADGRDAFVVRVVDGRGLEWEPRPRSWGTSRR